MKRYEGKPFTIVGVNSDKYGDDFKKKMEEHQVTWRSFKNERGEASAIATDFKLRGWPTLYLVDHKGVIRKKWVGSPGDKVMDEEIEKLVKIAEKEAQGSP